MWAIVVRIVRIKHNKLFHTFHSKVMFLRVPKNLSREITRFTSVGEIDGTENYKKKKIN